MKIIDILNKIANGELKDGFEFKYNDLHFIYFKNVNEVQRLENGINIGRIYYLDKHLNDEVEVIEENKEIEELHILDEGNSNKSLYEYCSRILIKQNELIRAVNKINKDLEKGQTLNIEIDEETISNAIKKARNYLEREEK